MALPVSTEGFQRMAAELSRLSGKSFEEVVLNQTSRVLEICVKRSPGKGSEKTRQAARFRVEKPVRYVTEDGTLVGPNKMVPRPIAATSYLQTLTGTRGGQRGKQYLVIKLPNGKRVAVWGPRIRGAKAMAMLAMQSALMNELADKGEAAAKAVGSLKKSWLQIADKLGIDLRIPDSSFVRRAQSPFDDGARSQLFRSATQFFVELVNTNGMLIQRYDGASILSGAIQTRLKAFEIELAKGVFDDLKYRAARYPGIFVKPV